MCFGVPDCSPFTQKACRAEGCWTATGTTGADHDGDGMTATEATDSRRDPLRADAQQNRERILQVAREAFAESGDASLNSIAKKAGVGPGTLYRHFPNREALVLAVYRYDVQKLADSAPGLLASHQPLRALRLWCDGLAYSGRINHGLADVLSSATSDGLAGETYGPVIGAITVLLKACEHDGSIVPGIDPDDVLLLLGFLWRIDPAPDAATRAARLLDLVMAGFQAGAQPAGRPHRARIRRTPRLPGRLSLFAVRRPGRR